MHVSTARQIVSTASQETTTASVSAKAKGKEKAVEEEAPARTKKQIA